MSGPANERTSTGWVQLAQADQPRPGWLSPCHADSRSGSQNTAGAWNPGSHCLQKAPVWAAVHSARQPSEPALNATRPPRWRRYHSPGVGTVHASWCRGLARNAAAARIPRRCAHRCLVHCRPGIPRREPPGCGRTAVQCSSRWPRRGAIPRAAGRVAAKCCARHYLRPGFHKRSDFIEIYLRPHDL